MTHPDGDPGCVQHLADVVGMHAVHDETDCTDPVLRFRRTEDAHAVQLGQTRE